jgi:hypothetical protein
MSVLLLYRDIYEISTDSTPIQGVKVRGRIRKFALGLGQNLLAENDQDREDIVRFAVPTGEDIISIQTYITSIIPDAHITSVLTNIANPTLSKLNINDASRYT